MITTVTRCMYDLCIADRANFPNVFVWEPTAILPHHYATDYDSLILFGIVDHQLCYDFVKS
jgi:hypothetical protein